MSCNGLNQQPQKYRLTYPEKDAVWYSNTPPPNYSKDIAGLCKRLEYTPTTCNQCSSTFMPWDRPSPNQCLKNCKGIDVYKIDACEYENSLYRPKLNATGCIMEPSVDSYSNIPMISPVIVGPGCQKEKVYRPPPPPGYINGFAPWEIVEASWGCSYEY